MIPLILEYRQNAKLKSTYIDGLLSVIDKNTGRVYSTFNQTVTATGRLSSSEPNLQNIPVRHELGREIRKAFVAGTPDGVLVDADYSQIELRLLAVMSGDENMIAAFDSGEDIHTLTAADVNGIEPSEVTYEMRSAAKAVNFGIVYGMSEYGLAREIGVSVMEARRYIAGYFRKFPGVRTFLEELKSFAKRNGFAVTPWGRRRYLPELINPKYPVRQFGERVATNMPIQGAAADIIKLAMVRVENELEKRGLKSRRAAGPRRAACRLPARRGGDCEAAPQRVHGGRGGLRAQASGFDVFGLFVGKIINRTIRQQLFPNFK